MGVLFLGKRGTQAEREQLFREKGEEEDVAQSRVEKLLQGKDQTLIDDLRTRLQFLSCNRNSAIRERATQLLMTYFRGYGPMTCVACK
jgi:hypothetical protein